ncbi:hypothetical protein [Arthrobacter sp. NPDC056727]|uniref:hypothetical protein n=1 Tax=Arthrobacter sp. NPDC056727 TaxID=3345927 RepID=UPI003670B2BB
MDERLSMLALRDLVRYWSVRQFPRFWQLESRSSSAQEFLIDGKKLSDIFDLNEPRPPAEETNLKTDAPDHALAQLHRLLGQVEPDFNDGRVALLVCPGCLEAACGALSVQVRRTEDTVIWADAGWQDETGEGEDVRPVPGPRTITFDRSQYDSVLAQALSRWQAIAGRQSRDDSAPDLIAYPVLAVDEEGGVHCFEDRDALEGLAEMFIHGEFTLLVDARGFEYYYEHGDLPYIELKSADLANAAELTRMVDDRMEYLRSRGALHHATSTSTAGGEPVNSEFEPAFRLAQKYNLG